MLVKLNVLVNCLGDNQRLYGDVDVFRVQVNELIALEIVGWHYQEGEFRQGFPKIFLGNHISLVVLPLVKLVSVNRSLQKLNAVHDTAIQEIQS
jgi:hypothetical protein